MNTFRNCTDQKLQKLAIYDETTRWQTPGSLSPLEQFITCCSELVNQASEVSRFEKRASVFKIIKLSNGMQCTVCSQITDFSGS